jgi:hypothetical protein
VVVVVLEEDMLDVLLFYLEFVCCGQFVSGLGVGFGQGVSGEENKTRGTGCYMEVVNRHIVR